MSLLNAISLHALASDSRELSDETLPVQDSTGIVQDFKEWLANQSVGRLIIHKIQIYNN